MPSSSTPSLNPIGRTAEQTLAVHKWNSTRASSRRMLPWAVMLLLVIAFLMGFSRFVNAF